MRYAIIGGGISGLTVANLLSENNQVVVFEACSRPGGMIKCDIVNGCLFHTTGGHVFNSKRKEVMDWFWSFFDKDCQFTKTFRNSSVFMPDGKEIPYPLENHFYMLGQEVGKSVVDDLVEIVSHKSLELDNFEDFLKGRFGRTLYDLYFRPYNEKIWRRNLNKVPLSWLEGKLPMPTVEAIIYNNIFHVKEKSFVHSSFYYPKNGGSQFIADTFAKGVDIRYSTRVQRLVKAPQDKLIVEGETFDRVVFCGNIKQLPQLLSDYTEILGFIEPIEQLEFHGTTSVFCEIAKNPYSWIYLPSREHDSHRIICTGNFSKANNADNRLTATVEFTDYISKDEILENLSKIPLNPQYITHHYEKYTYPIQDNDTRNMIFQLKNRLADNNIYLCGRFAEWEYANMDVCMGSAMDLIKEINKNGCC